MVKVTKKDIKRAGTLKGTAPLGSGPTTPMPAGGWNVGPTTPMPAGGWSAGKKATTPQVIRDKDTGKISGVKMPDGRELVGIPAKEVRSMVESWRGETELPEGAVEMTEVSEAERKEQQLEEFRVEGVKENEQLREEFLSFGEGGSLLERAAEAGWIPLDIAANAMRGLLEKTTGIKLHRSSGEDREARAKTTIGKVIGVPVGVVFTTGFKGLNLANMIGLGDEISEIEGDITSLRTSTRDILTEVRDGGDVFDAIDALEKIEESIRWKQGDLTVAIEMSPSDTRAGKKAGDMLFRELIAVQTRKRILIRLSVSGDFSELDRSLNNIGMGEEYE